MDLTEETEWGPQALETLKKERVVDKSDQGTTGFYFLVGERVRYAR